ncbi:hypothetical protein ACVRY7_02925 [Streptococcus ictaluri]|uniref:YdhG-like domain-containing protein n=1 Tax=Streptococcus ictaluri 707-05 TaxID=764299 RepID=G5K658_9STRE|nr:hypothetical protein [Streptococcus ictaluri]EHI68673.1 hypothetical protein STRIC_0545 [Streptococcus ictaluri 707-05]
MKEDREAVRHYIELAPQAHQDFLKALRDMIVSHLPEDTIEGLAWSMPSY